MTNRNYAFVLAFCLFLAASAYADQGSFTNSGGSGSGGSGIYLTSNVASPAGSLTVNCPGTSPMTCAGGSFSYISSDFTTTISASFTSGRYAESCSGGGKGGHISCSFSLTGYFSGTLTVNNVAQGITGVTYQYFSSTGSGVTGTSAYNSAYTPFYYSDSEQIHRSDDLLGTNQISFDGGFYGAYGIALDSAGRIYVADTYNCRIARIDDMNGTNLISYGGTCGSGQGEFYDPSGITVDLAGKIYILDTGNQRIVRLDNMNGDNWVAYGSVGNGTGQFAASAIAVDSSARIYVADTGNLRIVRMDDMNGANWTTLSQIPAPNGGTHLFQGPVAIAFDSAGRIYVADNGAPSPSVVRVDDMTGANWTSVSISGSSGVNSISVDSGGTVFLGGGGAHIVMNMTAVLDSSGAVGPIGSYYVFGATAIPLPSPRPSAVSFSPPALSFSQNVGTSGMLPVTIANFGGSPLNFSNIAASGGFTETHNCPGQLLGGSSCTVSVAFTPTATGAVNGLLSVSDDSGNLGAAQSVALSGVGTAPAASISPLSLSFQSQVVNTSGNGKTVTMQNTGTGPMQIASVTAAAPFSETDTCVGTLQPGSSCTVTVTFTPAAIGTAAGSLAFADNAGTQTVNLTGTGSSPASFSPTNLEFSTTVIGSASAAKTITLTSRGTAPLGITSIVASASFAVASNTCGASLAAGANCTVGVTFTPSTAGQANGSLTFIDTAINSPQAISLAGTGSLPVSVSPSSLNFGSIAVGAASAAKTVTFANYQGTPVSFSNIVVTAGFAIASNTCGTAVGAGASCAVGVTFSPTATGSASGSLTFTDGAATSPQSVSLSGTGTASVTLSATSINFGGLTAGQTSSPKTVTLTNHSSGALQFSQIATAVPFAIASNTCGTSIGAGASCTVGVTFTPVVKGAASGTLTFSDSAGTQTVTLSGTEVSNR